MIVDTMTKTEVMHSLQKEFEEEVLPFSNRIILKYKRTIFPRVQRLGKPEKIQECKKSFGGNKYILILNITKEGYNMSSYSIFHWRGGKYFANFFDNHTIVIYHEHCLKRYAERVLSNNDIKPDNVFKEYLLDNQNCAFQIYLQAPKRERCLYSGMASALFLGDYEEPTKENKKDNYYWYNTCISLKESHKTQKGILYSLSLIQKFVQDLGFNPLDPTTKKKDFRKDLEKFVGNSDDKKQSYIDFLKRMYMLHQLQLSLEFPWIYLFEEEIDSRMNEISILLAKYNIDTSSLSPFKEDTGIAIKGEINFIP